MVASGSWSPLLGPFWGNRINLDPTCSYMMMRSPYGRH